MDKALIQQFGGTIVRNALIPSLVYLAARGLFPSEAIDDFAAGLLSVIGFGWGWYVNSAPDGTITQESWFGAVRNLSSPFVAWVSGKGWITADVAGWLVAGIASVTFSAWSVYMKWRVSKKA